MALKTNLISCWELSEASGSAIDAHGTNDLTDNNTVGSNTGVIGNARDFEASNSEYFSLTSNSDVEVADIDFQFSFWLYLESIVGINPWILGKWRFSGGAYRNYAFWLDSTTGEINWSVTSDGSTQVSVAASTYGALPTGTWVWVQGGHDASGNVTFVSVNNGTVDTQAHSAGVITDSNAPFLVGAINQGASNYWDGRIEQLSFWKRLLTSDDKAEIYNSGAGLAFSNWDVPTSTNKSNLLVGCWL